MAPNKDGLDEGRIRELRAKSGRSEVEEMELDDQLVLRRELDAAQWEMTEGFARGR